MIQRTMGGPVLLVSAYSDFRQRVIREFAEVAARKVYAMGSVALTAELNQQNSTVAGTI